MDLVEQLNHVFYPRSVAVIGASDNTEKLGSRCVANLLESGFKGGIYPVNHDLSELFGLKVYPSVGAIPEAVDLAVISIPAELTVLAVEQCVAKGIKGVVMFTSGFRELDTEVGSDLQARLRDIANKGGLKIIGPNCLGLVNSRANLNATFDLPSVTSKVGGVSIAAQSGGVCSFIAYALVHNNVGISKAISLGNRCNLDFDEVLAYFAEDEDTKVIVVYIEGLDKPRQLMDVAQRVVKRKPVIAYKSARVEELSVAALSHTGTLAGNYGFYKAAFAQVGIIPVDSITEMVDMAKALALQSPPSGDRVAAISVQAGPGLIMGDKVRELGLRLAEFSPTSRQRLEKLVVNRLNNPIDLSWRALEFDTCREMLEVIVEDEGVDMVAVAALYHPPTMEPLRAAIEVSKYTEKPITVCIGLPTGGMCDEGRALEENGIPTYPLPERAITGLAGLYRYGKALKALG